MQINQDVTRQSYRWVGYRLRKQREHNTVLGSSCRCVIGMSKTVTSVTLPYNPLFLYKKQGYYPQ